LQVLGLVNAAQVCGPGIELDPAVESASFDLEIGFALPAHASEINDSARQ
jgi:hypothetical protein